MRSKPAPPRPDLDELVKRSIADPPPPDAFQVGEKVLINRPDGALCCENGWVALNGTPARVMKILTDGWVAVRFEEGGPHFATEAAHLRRDEQVSKNDCQGERPMVNTEHKRAVLRHQISELARKVMGTGMLVSCAPGGGQATTDFHPLPRFRVGDHVEKVGGDYSFRGRVVCLFVKLDQKSMRYVVENSDGVLHIYSDKNLKIDVPDFPG